MTTGFEEEWQRRLRAILGLTEGKVQIAEGTESVTIHCSRTARKFCDLDDLLAAVFAVAPEGTMSQEVPANIADWPTVKEVGARLGISRQTVYRAIQDGRLRALRVGPRVWRVNGLDVKNLVGRR